MSAVILSFPDRRGNRPAPILPAQDVRTKVDMYCYRLGLTDYNRNTVLRAVQHWEQVGCQPSEIASRAMAMANRYWLSHQPDPNGPRAA